MSNPNVLNSNTMPHVVDSDIGTQLQYVRCSQEQAKSHFSTLLLLVSGLCSLHPRSKRKTETQTETMLYFRLVYSDSGSLVI
jgi:hypothetical protein